MKSGNLNFLEPSGPLRTCNGTDLRFEMVLNGFYEGQSHENLKSAIKIRTTARLSVSFNNDTNGLKNGRQVAVRYCIEKLSHCVPFVFNKLRDKTCLRVSFDSPSCLWIKYLLFSEFIMHFGIFRPTWPSSGNTQYIQNTWEEINNIKFCKKKWVYYFR